MQPGSPFGHYTVSDRIGAGGMGEVYLARDTRLNRDVALKVLPDFLAQDQDRIARFRREAQLLASLNHPGIAAIYGLESQDSTYALAMELVEGPDLAERLRQGPLPLGEALGLAVRIAQAMEAAHEKGVVHRDLKPANIKIAADGRAKILDFGLAKALADPEPESGLEALNSPTLTANMTAQGVILGTAAYMSPEQARGRTADRRADIWAFGCVLYEMLTGVRLFAGETISDTLAAVLRAEPDWSALPAGLEPAVTLVLRRCLERDPAERLQHMGDVRILLGETAPPARAAGRRGAPRWLVYGLGTALAASLALHLFGGDGGQERVVAEPQVQHLAASLAPRAPLARARAHPLGIGRPTLTVSPDGASLVYVAEVEGRTKLFKKRFDAALAEEIPGTEGGFHPVFSPSGDWIAFYTADRIRKVLYAGSEPVTLCEVPNPKSLCWESERTLIAAVAEGGVLLRVDTDSGAATRVPGAGASYAGMSVLPAGQGILAHIGGTGINPDAWTVGTLAAAGEDFRAIVTGGFSPRYVPTGHLVYVRGGNLMGVAFDLERMEIRGRPVPVAAGLRVARRSPPSYDFSASGTLVYTSGPPQTLSSLVWVDRQGAAVEVPIPPQFYGDFQIAPDGRRVAATVGGDRDDVWVFDLERGSRRKLTTEGDGVHPVWRPDGALIAFYSRRDGRPGCYVRPADGSQPARRLAGGDDGRPYAWVDADHVALGIDGDIFVVDVGSGERTAVAATSANEWGPHFSPDGRWVAYTSDESGRYEVYVKPFPELAGNWTVSTEGGEEPVWGRDGRNLYYRNGDTWLEVPVGFESGFTAGRPRVVLEGPYINVPGRSYDLAPDGSRFLVILDQGNEEFSRHVEVVLNWFDELERLVPTR